MNQWIVPTEGRIVEALDLDWPTDFSIVTLAVDGSLGPLQSITRRPS